MREAANSGWEKGMERHEEFFRDLCENAHDLIQSVSPEGRFLYVNRAWLSTLGYDESDLSELDVFDVIHPDSRDHCTQIMNCLLYTSPSPRDQRGSRMPSSA